MRPIGRAVCAQRPTTAHGRKERIILTELVIIVLLVLANAVFSGAEIAVVALRKSRVEELAEQGKASARAVLSLRDNPERFLATVQVGITVVGATAAAFGGESIATRIAPKLASIPFIGEHSRGVALALVIVAISYLSIVVGELMPKSLALRNAESYALAVARPLLGLSWLAAPLVWLLGSSANLLLRPFRDRTTFTETRHSAEELQDLVSEAAEAGTIHPEAGEIASRALELPELTAADVMVPRQEVAMISRYATPEELQRVVLTRRHSRLPVYEERIDNIVGYVSIKDILDVTWEHKPVRIEDIVRPAYFIPESKQALELLKDMRNQHTPFAIVVDEQGGTSGIVTMEDLLEELVGEIWSEYARDEPPLIKQAPDGSAIVSGAAHVREVNRALDIELPEEGAWTTVAGLCLAVSGRIPAAGESLDVGNGITLEIMEVSPRRIRTVRVPPSHASAQVSPG